VELASLRDSVDLIRRFDVAYFMVSLDSLEKNKEFAEAMGANFPLLSDPEGGAAKAYGVLGLTRLFASRTTFYIDPAGVIRYIDKDVNVETHGRDIARKLEDLGFPER
jgi:peroxiredoxin Q/BCP